MRNLYIYISSVLLFFSCSFLEEQPIDRLVTENYYKNEQDAKAAVNAIYSQLNPIYQRNMILLCDLPTDIMKNGIGMPNANLQDLEFLRFTSENTFIRDMWSNLYSGIMMANAAINNIPQIVMDDNLKNRLIGEAKFFRALFYFNAVRFWGDIPLVLDLKTIDDAMGERVPKKQIYEQIINDLNEANKILPKSYGNEELGRVTKGASIILLGKVYLTIYDYEKARQVLSQVVENESEYGYALHEDYHSNWDPSTEAGCEAVLYLEFKPTPMPSNAEMGLIGPKYSISEPVGVANSNEVDIPTLELANSYEEGDKRKLTNIKTEYVNPKNGKKLISSIPLFGKYWQEGITSPNMCEINNHIIRYSDAILMYSEALNEIGESLKAHQLLNRIRQRAFGDTSHDYENLNKNELRDAILKERFLEFPLEGHRWFDLVRTNTFVNRMKFHADYESEIAEKNKIDIKNNIKDFMILYPIPQREIDLNPNLNQNPGY